MDDADSLIGVLADLRSRAEATLIQANDTARLEEWRITFLARKGELAALRDRFGSIAKSEMPRIGQAFNAAKQSLEEAFELQKVI